MLLYFLDRVECPRSSTRELESEGQVKTLHSADAGAIFLILECIYVLLGKRKYLRLI
jgi:hypothetical protein